MKTLLTDMIYLGTQYTTDYGTYQVKHNSSLQDIGFHSYPTTREEEVVLVDPGILEAFQHYPYEVKWHNYEGFARSYYSKQGHLDSLLRYQSYHRWPRPTDDNSWIAVHAYCTDFFSHLPKTQALDFNTQLRQIRFEPSSSAGIGIPGKKGDPGNLERAMGQATATMNSFMDNVQQTIDNTAPDRAFTRTQLSFVTEKLKVRNIFGEAFQYILIEGVTAQPLLETFVSIDSFIFIGRDPRLFVPEVLEQAQRAGPKMISLDWSNFDAEVEDWEIDEAFELLLSMLTFPNHISRATFDFSRIFFINRKIAGPDGHIYFKHRGVPSGSFFTVLIDSIVNWRRILYMSHKWTGQFPAYMKVQGDDSIISFKDKTVTPEGLSLSIPDQAPWTLNAFKCKQGESTQTVDFLQRHILWGDQGRDVSRVERLALYPEYEVTDKRISAFRARALWEDCNYQSRILGYATLYLEDKYGTPPGWLIPRYVIPYYMRFHK